MFISYVKFHQFKFKLNNFYTAITADKFFSRINDLQYLLK